MAAWTRPGPYQPLSLPRYSSRPMDFAAIDRAWNAAGHNNEACGGWKYEPNSDPAKSLIRCACESVIPLPLEEVMGGVLPDPDPPEMGNEDPAFAELLERAQDAVAGTEAAA